MLSVIISVVAVVAFKFDPYTSLYRYVKDSLLSNIGYDITCEKSTREALFSAFTLDNVVVKHKTTGHVVFKADRVGFNQSFVSIILSLTKLPVPLDVYIEGANVDIDSSLFSSESERSEETNAEQNSKETFFSLSNLYKHGLSVKADNLNILVSSGNNQFIGKEMSLDISFDTRLNFKRFEMELPLLSYKNKSGDSVDLTSVSAIMENDRINLLLKDLKLGGDEQKNISLSLGELRPYIARNEKDKQTLYIPISELDFEYNGMSVSSKQTNIEAEVVSFDEVEVVLTSDRISLKDVSPLSEFNIDDLLLKFNSSSGGKAELQSVINGEIRGISEPFNANLSGNVRDLSSTLVGELAIINLRGCGIDESFNVGASISGNDVNLTIESASSKRDESNKQIFGKAIGNLKAKSFNVSLNIDEFNPKKIIPFGQGITDIFLSDTSFLSGMVEFSGTYGADATSHGRIDVRCSDLKLINARGDMTIRGVIDTRDNKLFLSETEFNLFDYSISVSGVYPFGVGLPEFSLSVFTPQGVVANGNFNMDGGVYNGKLTSVNNALSFDGRFYTDEDSPLVRSDGLLNVYGSSYNFTLTYDKETRNLGFVSDNVSITGVLKTGEAVNVVANGFKIPPLPKFGIVRSMLNANIEVRFLESSFRVSSPIFSLEFSDSSHLMFALYADNKQVRLSNLSFRVLQKEYIGSLIVDLINEGSKWSIDNVKASLSLSASDNSGATISYYPIDGRPSILMSLNKFEGFSFIKRNPFSAIDFKLIAENRGKGDYVAYGSFYGESKSKTIDEEKTLRFNLSFENNRLFVSDIDANFNGLTVKKGILSADITSGRVRLDGDLLYLHPKADGHREFGSTLALDTNVKELIDNQFNIEKISSPLNANVSFSNLTLASTYYPPNINLLVTYDNGIVVASGDLVSGSYSISDSSFTLNVDSAMSIGFDAKGSIKTDTMDITLTNIVFPIKFLDNIIWGNAVTFDNGLFKGDLRIVGDINNPQFYGTLASPSTLIWNLWAEEEECTLVNPKLIAYGNTINIPQLDVYSYNKITGRKSKFKASCKINIEEWDLPCISLVLDIDKSAPIAVSVPLPVPNMNVDARETWGHFELDLYYLAFPTLRFNIGANDVTLAAPSRHYDWMYDPNWEPTPLQTERSLRYTFLDGEITIGKGGRFMFPSRTSPLINATVAENQSGKIEFKDGKFNVNTDIEIKSGEIFYFNKNFQITEGTLSWHPNSMMDEVLRSPSLTDDIKYSDLAGMNLSVTSRLKDFDLNGNPTDIYLTLENATMENLSPRFSSSTGLSDAEILSILGQNILPSSTYSSSGLSSLAYISSVALDVFSQVGGINAASKNTFNDTTKRALGLDMFSVRQRIFYNIVADVIPDNSYRSTNEAAFTRYLNGTTIFMGKHISQDFFFHATIHFLTSEKEVKSKKLGNIFIQGLQGDMEFALEWNTDIATLSLFTNPNELSFLGIMNNIGISIKRHFVF